MKKFKINLKYISLALVMIVGFSTSTKQVSAIMVLVDYEVPYTVSSNIAPVCNAGIDRSMVLPTNSVSIPSGGATATDPDGTITSTVWTQIGSTPSVATITSGSTLTPTFSNLVQGTYTFRLTATDNEALTCSDDMQVTVNASNVAPTALAGPDQVIAQPASAVSVSGSGFDPDGWIVSYSWASQLGNPSIPTIVSPNSASTSITNLTTLGVYTFQLTVTDNQGAVGYDYMTVTVNASGGSVPVVSISASPTTGIVNIVHGVLTWGATNSPTSCTASGDWSGAKAVSGNGVDQGVLTQIKTYTYTLVCSNANGSSAPASATVVVTANAKNGVCAATHFLCTAGASINNLTGGSSWTWDCQGTQTTANCSEPFGGGGGEPECSDGIDNADTEDTLVDTADPGCHTDLNPSNAASYDPNDNNERNIKIKEIEI